MYDLNCSDPDHESRSEEEGWVTILGTSSIENLKGHLCEACARALQQAQQE
jgi:hypothetical protein